MEYKQAVAWLDSCYGKSAKEGLTGIRRLLNKLGNPQNNLKFIHIAGTNGKGSVSAMLDCVLRKSGLSVGLYTSPHLSRYNERYRLNGIEISDEEFGNEMERLKSAVDQVQQETGIVPTIFEIVTAFAFDWYAFKKPDIVIMDVGLGGRSDCTNVLEEPLLTVITSVGFDHMTFLGDTLEQIAWEKAGIIKSNRPVVVYPEIRKEAYEVIRKIAEEKNAPLYYAFDEKREIICEDLNKSVFSVKNQYYDLDQIELHLTGGYQILNCSQALLCCYVLQKLGLSISKSAIFDGIEETVWPGRMEQVHSHPLVFLEGAHNSDGFQKLRESMKIYFPNKKVTLLVGVLADKEYKKMAGYLLPYLENIVVTEPKSQRALSANLLAKHFADCRGKLVIEKNSQKAFEIAYKLTGPEDVLICAGSLYLIGELRDILSQNIKEKEESL